MILGSLKHCKALSTEKYRRYINILLLLLLLRWRRSKKVHHVLSCSYKTVVRDGKPTLLSSRVNL